MNDSEIPSGLVFFSREADTKYRRKRIILASIILLCELGTIWPLYALMPSLSPRVLGLPFSIFWIILCLMTTFAALVWHFRSEAT